MKTRPPIWPTLAAVSGFVGVAAGAFAAHAAATPLAKELLRTGSEYELIHALAVFACLAAWRAGAARARIAAWMFLVGSALFSGSLYALALTGQRWMGIVTPIGGLLFLAGWATLAVAVFNAPEPTTRD